jgi:formylglycine-generating enzyme required for sulfatase activity
MKQTNLIWVLFALSAFVACGENDSPALPPTNEVVTITVPGSDASFKMVHVEAGTFTMGPTGGMVPLATSNELPAHQVTLTQDYYIGETDVTQGLYRAVMGVNPSRFAKGDDYPVEMVSAEDAEAFCQRLGEMTGRSFALPTEAQWEYAARGGHKAPAVETVYPGSDNLDEVAWYKSNSDSSTHPVAQKAPNALGLYDMSGNLWEWCSDWMSPYSSTAVTDPFSSDYGWHHRLFRGGSWARKAEDQSLHISARYGYYAVYSDDDLGFRIVMIPNNK